MITIKTIEELEAERERQLKAWIESGKQADNFLLDLEEADLHGANLTGAKLSEAKLRDVRIKDTIITQSQYDDLYRMYSHEFMDRFFVK